MQLESMTSSRNILRSDDEVPNYYSKEERRRTGRYVAGGAALAIIMLAIYHVFGKGASTIAGICIPAIIMASYTLWVLYTARRDKTRARRLASAMQLAETNDSSNINSTTDGSTPLGPQKTSVNIV